MSNSRWQGQKDLPYLLNQQEPSTEDVKPTPSNDNSKKRKKTSWRTTVNRESFNNKIKEVADSLGMEVEELKEMLIEKAKVKLKQDQKISDFFQITSNNNSVTPPQQTQETQSLSMSKEEVNLESFRLGK